MRRTGFSDGAPRPSGNSGTASERARCTWDAFWEFDKESILGSAHQKGILKEMLEMERRTELKVEPAYFEVMFGSRPGPGENADPLLGADQPLSAGEVRLRGKIDRIDIGER